MKGSEELLTYFKIVFSRTRSRVIFKTFAAVGDSVTLEAIGGLWYVRQINGPILSEV